VGQCFAWHALDPAKGLRLESYIAAVGDAITGTSPLDINAFLARFENTPPRNGDPSPLEWASALSAIEVALWDITGQVFDAPIYRLFGGAVRTSVPAYANHGIFAGAKTSEVRLERSRIYFEVALPSKPCKSSKMRLKPWAAGQRTGGALWANRFRKGLAPAPGCLSDLGKVGAQ